VDTQSAPAVTITRAQLTSFYQRYDPSKIPTIGDKLRRFPPEIIVWNLLQKYTS
jgi:hypothetical protein